LVLTADRALVRFDGKRTRVPEEDQKEGPEEKPEEKPEEESEEESEEEPEEPGNQVEGDEGKKG
jgi:hypothetical protein